MMKFIALFSMVFFFSFTNAQEKKAEEPQPLKKIFIIGENATEFESLSADYRLNIINVCNGDLDKTASSWNTLVNSMEEYSYEEDFNLKGMAFWLKVFFNTDGKIDYIGYYLKEGSKYPEGFEEFMLKFSAYYEFPYDSRRSFSHYSAIQF